MSPVRILIAALFVAALATPAVADDVLFENVRIFDGKSPALSAASNVLVKGNLIDTVSVAPIAADGVTRIDGKGRTLLTFKRSSQHLNQGDCDGHSKATITPVWTRAVAIAGATAGSGTN